MLSSSETICPRHLSRCTHFERRVGTQGLAQEGVDGKVFGSRKKESLARSGLDQGLGFLEGGIGGRDHGLGGLKCSFVVFVELAESLQEEPQI